MDAVVLCGHRRGCMRGSRRLTTRGRAAAVRINSLGARTPAEPCSTILPAMGAVWLLDAPNASYPHAACTSTIGSARAVRTVVGAVAAVRGAAKARI